MNKRLKWWKDYLEYLIYKYWDIGIYTQYRLLINGIQNIFIWMPIIYKNKDFEYHWMEDIIRFKLQRMRLATEKYDIHDCKDVTLKQIDFCLRILDRMENDWESYSHPDQLAYCKNKKVEDLFGPNLEDEDTKFSTDWWDWEQHWRLRDKHLLYRMLEIYGEYWWH